MLSLNENGPAQLPPYQKESTTGIPGRGARLARGFELACRTRLNTAAVPFFLFRRWRAWGKHFLTRLEVYKESSCGDEFVPFFLYCLGGMSRNDLDIS